MIGLPDKPAFNKNKGNKLAFWQNNGNNEVNGFSIGSDNMRYAKKSGKLKTQNLFNF